MSSPISHVQLRVADLQRALTFYRDLLGFEIRRDEGSVIGLTPEGSYEEMLTLREVKGLARRPRHPRTAGLYHVAWLVPGRPELARALQGLAAARYPLTGASDHAVSESLYLDDPDGNGVEIYADRPRDRWIWENGRVHMTVDPLDLDGLLKESGASPQWDATQEWKGLPTGTVIGHVHFTVSDIRAAAAAAQKDLGMDLTFEMPTLVGLSVEQYHHHVNLNTWAGEGAAPDDPGVAGLDQWTFQGRKLSEIA
jgi:catechol 2,3-dioxygenase